MVDLSAATAVLCDVFGHSAFRFGQQAAVEAVLAGRDAIVLLPTGAGKSSCYQVPAVALAQQGRGTTLVISPLIALMIDQVNALAARGIAAAAIHSQQDEAEQRAVIEALVRGELAVLYVSPERAARLRERSGQGRGIVYCASRKKTEAVAAGLADAGFAVGHYHAGRTGLARDRAQRAFTLGRTRVLVATSAFGMGVDYPDVRVIV